MKFEVGIVSVLLMASASPAIAANGVDFEQSCGTPGRAFWSGTACGNYVSGVIAGLFLSGRPGFCAPSTFDARQALPIVRQFMANHPEQLNYGQARIIQMAMQRAFPCN